MEQPYDVEPKLSVIYSKERPKCTRENFNGNDINNLPYLYRNPAA